jgi:hypothetical protein
VFNFEHNSFVFRQGFSSCIPLVVASCWAWLMAFIILKISYLASMAAHDPRSFHSSFVFLVIGLPEDQKFFVLWLENKSGYTSPRSTD